MSVENGAIKCVVMLSVIHSYVIMLRVVILRVILVSLF